MFPFVFIPLTKCRGESCHAFAKLRSPPHDPAQRCSIGIDSTLNRAQTSQRHVNQRGGHGHDEAQYQSTQVFGGAGGASYGLSSSLSTGECPCSCHHFAQACLSCLKSWPVF